MSPQSGRGIRTQMDLRPHSTSPAVLERQAAIYRQGKTPLADRSGTLRAWNVRPGTPKDAGEHLGEISRRFGSRGLSQTLHGLGTTRGSQFRDAAVRQAPSSVRSQVAGASLGSEGGEAETVVGGVRVEDATRGSMGHALPTQIGARLGGGEAGGLGDVRVHHDARANQAARQLNARAFTVGRSIFFGANEYRPDTTSGMHLLSHEVAHTIQQRGAAKPADGRMEVGSPHAPEETVANRFADAVQQGQEPPALDSHPVAVQRVMRQISFTRANDTFTTNDPTAQENAAGTHFQIAQGVTAAPHFDWGADFTIHGNAGDPFANFQVGPLQVVRAFWLNIFWGTGTNRTHRTSSVTTPIRDAINGTQTWYADSLASAAFGADGDVRHTSLNDTPGVRGQPFANPIAGRVSTRGWFNWGMSFVAYLGAQDTTNPGAAGFRALANVYWNLSVAGDFDSTRALGSRVRVTSGGRTNRSGVIEGVSTEFPPMFGGDIFNTEANANLTTT